jgi:membrane-bound ClpP family serine protease
MLGRVPPSAGTPAAVTEPKGATMPTWLLILIVGAVLLIIGVAVEAAKILIWIGIAVLVIGLIMNFARKGSSRA